MHKFDVRVMNSVSKQPIGNKGLVLVSDAQFSEGCCVIVTSHLGGVLFQLRWSTDVFGDYEKFVILNYYPCSG
jgi:hypothetical protein